MAPVEYNWLAVLVAGIVHFAIGSAWYGFLFAKPWLRAMGWTEGPPPERARATLPGYGASLVGALLAAAALSAIVDYADAFDWMRGALLGLVSAVAFVVSTSAPSIWFEGRSGTVWAINASYHVVAFAVMGAIVAVWQ